MTVLGTVVLVSLGLFIAFVLGLNLLVRKASRALVGQPMPELSGKLAAPIRRARQGLVYFFSPGCGACRPLTPKLRALAEQNENVFVVDVTEHLELARALRVMATPSTLEIASGHIVEVHVGMLPPAVLERYAAPAK